SINLGCHLIAYPPPSSSSSKVCTSDLGLCQSDLEISRSDGGGGISGASLLEVSSRTLLAFWYRVVFPSSCPYYFISAGGFLLPRFCFKSFCYYFYVLWNLFQNVFKIKKSHSENSPWTCLFKVSFCEFG